MVQVDTSISTQFHDQLLQSMAEGLLVLDQQGIVTSANQAAAQLLGYEPDNLIGKHYQAFWPKNVPSPDELRAGETHRSETTIEFPDASSVPVTVSINSIPAATATNRLISITGSANVERLNEVLAQTQKLAGIGTLTASVAHELNTPISVITATCSNMLHEMDDQNLNAETLLRYVKMIEQSAWRCARIVGVLRNYTVEDTLQMAVTDLNMVIEDAVTLVRFQFRGDFNVDVELDLQDDLKSAWCDHNRMTQVLINLLTNARDAMQPDGGIIHIKSWQIPAETSKDSATNGTKPQEKFAFSVRDSGTGIAPEVFDRIFNPFFTTKPNGKGTGLGLFIAKRIVTQHEGEIWAENNPEGGATFTVVIPRQRVALATDQLPSLVEG
jgi:PAS domain S-box-containing protein